MNGRHERSRFGAWVRRSENIFGLISAAALLLVGSTAAPAAERKHILFLGGSEIYAHDSVSKAMLTLGELGEASGLFDVRFRTDLDLLSLEPLGGNRKNLEYFDAVMFFTQGDLPVTSTQKDALLSFVREGKGLLVAHSGTDSFRESWPEYVEMVGGAFVNHPWHGKVKIRVEDPDFPAMRHFPERFTIEDEIYQLDRYSRDRVRVLMAVDVSSVDLGAEAVEREDGDFAIAWVRQWGRGRVFTCVLGHEEAVWAREDIQRMWLEAAKWVLGLVDGETTPLEKPADPASR